MSALSSILQHTTTRTRLHRPSAKPPFCRAITCCIARLTSCSSLPKPPSMAHARAHGTVRFGALLIIDDLGMRKLPATAVEALPSSSCAVMSKPGTLLTSNRPLEDWGKLLGTARPSLPCSIDWCITATCSNAVRGAGGQKQTRHLRSLQGKTKSPGHHRWPF